MTDSVRDAKGYALRLLSYRGRSERELSDRLSAKGFSPEIVAVTIAALQQSGLIDDRALAEQSKRQALQNKLLSFEGTRRFLAKKGIPKEVIEAAVAYNESGEYDNARRLLEKKMRFQSGRMTLKDRNRYWNFLVRRGFPFHIVKKALQQSGLDREDET